jgi:hypothetical protein
LPPSWRATTTTPTTCCASASRRSSRSDLGDGRGTLTLGGTALVDGSRRRTVQQIVAVAVQTGCPTAAWPCCQPQREAPVGARLKLAR